VGELCRCSGITSPTGGEGSHRPAGTESCVSSGNSRDEALIGILWAESRIRTRD
jgi:hypothetical protein